MQGDGVSPKADGDPLFPLAGIIRTKFALIDLEAVKFPRLQQLHEALTPTSRQPGH